MEEKLVEAAKTALLKCMDDIPVPTASQEDIHRFLLDLRPLLV
jgi:hypothetical protein